MVCSRVIIPPDLAYLTRSKSQGLLIKGRPGIICWSNVKVKVTLEHVVGPQRIVVTRGFVGWLEHSGEMSVNDRTSQEARCWTKSSGHLLQAVVDCVGVVGTASLVEFRQSINEERHKWTVDKRMMETGLKALI
ncbi:hypothetical protein AVEN_71762-1 [Araneus ventricosus]|uniref:Uncharacterized protein n=1 Tax=Araneus ventricosus TaxID=182803 RepID=A0A4Y2TK06_ARAVE|nr:hypothetical protein AVEN_180075-1 [Araneus ventricosus]GBO00365.1 hypothetical protein AVEN_71762-1 [Araneus ventricosus]